MLRRVKSFTSKRTNKNELEPELANKVPKSPRSPMDGLRRFRLLQRKSKLRSRMSMSLDSLQVDLTSSHLFLKQKERIESMEALDRERKKVDGASQQQDIAGLAKGEQVLGAVSGSISVKNLERQISMSLDELAFIERYHHQRIECKNVQSREKEVVNLRPHKLKDVRHPRIHTVDVVRELISNFERHDNSVGDDRTNVSNKPPNFPVLPADDAPEEVEIRKERPLPCRPQRSKTFNFDLLKSSPKKDTFEAKGVAHIVIGDDTCTKIKRNQKLLIQEGQIQRVIGSKTENLTKNVRLKDGTKLLNKKEVEMRDEDNTIYIFHFDTTRDAKNFVDLERARSYSFGEKQITIKSRLLRLLGKRSSRDQLVSKGILKNEPIFGNTADAVYSTFGGIPPFISRAVELIERPRNIRSMGVYRASGNLAIIQKIRCEVDCGRLEILEEYGEDVDVLTGALKLFFRELREPLISADVCQKIFALIDRPQPAEQTKKIIDHLPEANREILSFLLRHLVKVCSYRDDNKMGVYNMSVCWGPSLIDIPELCVDLVLQTSNVSKVMEYLLKLYQTDSLETSPRLSKESLPSKVAANNSHKESPVSNRSSENKSSDEVYVIIKKFTELIEDNITATSIYRLSGSKANVDQIIRKIDKCKLDDLDQFKDDVYDLCSALKKYLATLPKPLISKQVFEQYILNCDKLDTPTLRCKLNETIGATPRSDALNLFLSHLRKVMEYERNNKMSLSNLISCWIPVLMPLPDQKFKEKVSKFSRLLQVLLGRHPSILPDLVQEQLRMSKYDNVPDIGDSVRGEAIVLDEKTDTRL